MSPKKPGMLLPALIGGLFLGVTSAIPILGSLNCACCMLVIGGGLLSSYFYLREFPVGLPPVSYGDGAILGLLTGLIGSFAYTLVFIPMHLISMRIGMSAIPVETIRDILDDPDIPPFVLEIMEMALAGGVSVSMLLITLFFSLIVFAFFAMVGGILGVALFQKRPPVAPPPPAMTPPPPSSIASGSRPVA